MSWITTIILTTGFFSLTDIFRRLAGGKIDPVWGAGIQYAVAAFVGLGVTLLSRYPLAPREPLGLLFAVLAGSAVALGGIFHFKTFSLGGKLTVAEPVMFVGIVIITSLFGIIILKEPVNAKWLSGLILALSGLYLLTTS